MNAPEVPSKQALQKLVTNSLHAIFFGNAQVSQKPEWLHQFEKLGVVEQITEKRKGGTLEILRLTRPGQKSDKFPAVIFSHPMKKRAKAFFSNDHRPEWYLSRGFECYFFDFNGFGDSERIDLSFWKDAALAIEVAKSHHPERPLVLHGLSFGGFHQIRASDALPNGSIVVLENVSRSLKDYWKKSWATRLAISFLRSIGPEFIKDMDVIGYLKRLERSRVSFHFLACESDTETPANEMRDLKDAVGPGSTFVTFKDCGHLEAPTRQKAHYFETLTNILV